MRHMATVQLSLSLLVCPIGLVVLGQKVTVEAGWSAVEGSLAGLAFSCSSSEARTKWGSVWML